MNKPIIIFTNFWDAEKILDNKTFLSIDNGIVYKLQLNDKPINYSIYSIALAHPDLEKLPLMKKMSNGYSLNRLDFFCPTYEMLTNYKNGGAWDDYVKKYRQIMKNRKVDIQYWIKSLLPDRIYMLCCWENTSKDAKCHRRLIYDAFKQSDSMKEKAMFIYRSGSWNDHCERTDIIQQLDYTLENSNNQIALNQIALDNSYPENMPF